MSDETSPDDKGTVAVKWVVSLTADGATRWLGLVAVMRVPLSAYPESKVYSLVARVPFTPIDFDVGRLARGEWNPLIDRFRIWFIPKIQGRDERAVCFFTVRKFDLESDTLVFMHVVPNLAATIQSDSSQADFDVGVLSNDDIRARSALGVILDNPPAYHRRREVRLIERRWRDDPDALMRFFANVQSLASLDPHASPASVKVNGPPTTEAMALLKDGMAGWWDTAEI